MTDTFDKTRALQMIAGLDLPRSAGMALDEVDLGFDQAKRQALAIGSEIISFDQGVPSEFREAVSNSALLAQLAVDRKLGRDADPIAYFDAYFALLAQLGWVTQVWDNAEYRLTSSGATVHQAILEVIEAFLAGLPGALQLAKLTLNSLKAMDEKSKQIRLFQRNSQDARMGRFQFTTVHHDATGGLMAEVMAFALDAEERFTKVLFFDLSKTHSTLRRKQGSMSLNRAALSSVLPAVRQKVASHVAANVAAIEI